MLKLKIPPPVYLLLFAGVMWLVNRYFEVAVLIDAPWNKLGFLILMIAFIPAAGALRLFLLHRTSPNPHHPEKASSLVTTGVYQFSRNPMYLGLFLLLVAWAVHLGSLAVMAFPPLFIWTLTELQIKPEEEVLLTLFGDEYEHYTKVVRRWL